jgi:hypothetical protein
LYNFELNSCFQTGIYKDQYSVVRSLSGGIPIALMFLVIVASFMP